jgi:NADPH:quinone reductase-like Zn-dependent oxidoreductase
MKAVIANAYGGPEVLQLEKLPRPTPKSNELLIKIHTTAITAAASMMRQGVPRFGRLFLGLLKPKVKTPGTDLAGVVEAVGDAVSSFQVGDLVMAETGIECGTYAEYICLPEDALIVKQPEHISAEEACGILDGGSTALAFFTDQVCIKPGDKVLINGASGSIGTAAVQLARFYGAEVYAICSGKNKAMVKDLGAYRVYDYTRGENPEGCFDVIFDTVGKLSFSKSKKYLNKQGVFLTPVLSFSVLLQMLCYSKQLKFAATGMRDQDLRMRDLKIIRDLMVSEKLKTVIDKIYDFDQVQEAHRYVDTGRKRGNVILRIAKE